MEPQLELPGVVRVAEKHPRHVMAGMEIPGFSTLAEFPDCVAARSARHLRELSARVDEGDRAVQLFVIQRTDCDAFSACADLDPAYADGLDAAANAGVEVLAYACDITLDGIRIARRVPWRSPRTGA